MTYPKIGLFIDGRWIHDRPPCHEVRNPSDEGVLGTVPGASPKDLEHSLQAAQKGFLAWRDTPPQERAQVLERVAVQLKERQEEIGRIITLEQGKPLADGLAEINRASTFLQWEAAECLRSYGTVMPSGPQQQRLVLRQPVGPVAAFTPWNVPLSSPARKVSAALAAGCSVILKAAEETPGTACAFVQCFADAGLPPGVLNLVYGKPAEISATLIASPIIRMITLTGSVQVGKQLAQLAGAAMKPALLELGGHAPVLIGEGVDGAKVGRMAAAAKMRMAGQICASPTRFFAHRSVYEDFVAGFAQAAGALKVGDGFVPDVQMGPLANGRRLAAIHALVEDAKARGARVATGGQRIGERGYFYAPTVLADVPLEADAMTIEPFGPLGLCIPVNNLEEGLALANALPVGLSAYAFTNSLSDAERISRELECGALTLNSFATPGADAPFGGVKESGIGREGGGESLDAYLVSKTVLQSTARI
jgi:succinate-semialdehyde dehydrogenase/glutarate-semialdehyde dehydrogenase